MRNPGLKLTLHVSMVCFSNPSMGKSTEKLRLSVGVTVIAIVVIVIINFSYCDYY